MSPDALESKWVERELLLAEKKPYAKPVFPVLLSGKVWSRLRDIQCEDMTAGVELQNLNQSFVNKLKAYFDSGNYTEIVSGNIEQSIDRDKNKTKLSTNDQALLEKTIEVITARKPDLTPINRYMDDLVTRIGNLNNQHSTFIIINGRQQDQAAILALQNIEQFLSSFARLSETIVNYESERMALAAVDRFAPIAELYGEFGPLASPPVSPAIAIISRILDHDLFLISVSYLLRNKLWTILAAVLKRDVYFYSGISISIL